MEFLRWFVYVWYEPIAHPRRWARRFAENWGLGPAMFLLSLSLLGVLASANYHLWIWLYLNALNLPCDILAVKYALEQPEED